MTNVGGSTKNWAQSPRYCNKKWLFYFGDGTKNWAQSTTLARQAFYLADLCPGPLKVYHDLFIYSPLAGYVCDSQSFDESNAILW